MDSRMNYTDNARAKYINNITRIQNNIDELKEESRQIISFLETRNDTNEQGQLGFKDYLMRICCTKMMSTENFGNSQLSPEEYLKGCFERNGVPNSFEGQTTVRLSVFVANLFRQNSVKRKVVFLLGFALRLNVAEVNELLTKGLQEHEINVKDPFEVVCYFCYKNKKTFNDFNNIYRCYLNNRNFEDPQQSERNTTELYNTPALRNNLHNVKNSEILLYGYLNILRDADGESFVSRTTRKYFNALYNATRVIIANIQNDMCNENRYSYCDIVPGNIENFIYSAVPRSGSGNLIRADGRYSELIESKRLYRQRIQNILSNNAEPDRFDLITLSFFVYALNTNYQNNQNGQSQRVEDFFVETSKMLDECGYGKLYFPNIYEHFLLLCLYSIDPMGTYAEVFEESYRNEME